MRRSRQRLLGIKKDSILSSSALVLLPGMSAEQALLSSSTFFLLCKPCSRNAANVPVIANGGQGVYRGFLKTALYQTMWDTFIFYIAIHCQLFFKKEIDAFPQVFCGLKTCSSSLEKTAVQKCKLVLFAVIICKCWYRKSLLYLMSFQGC